MPRPRDTLYTCSVHRERVHKDDQETVLQRWLRCYVWSKRNQQQGEIEKQKQIASESYKTLYFSG